MLSYILMSGIHRTYQTNVAHVHEGASRRRMIEFDNAIGKIGAVGQTADGAEEPSAQHLGQSSRMLDSGHRDHQPGHRQIPAQFVEAGVHRTLKRVKGTRIEAADGEHGADTNYQSYQPKHSHQPAGNP